MKKDDIEKLFSSLEDFSKNPPDDLWKGIEEKLDAPKKKSGLAFWWPVAASLVVGLGLLGTFYFHSNEVNLLINVPVEHGNGVVNQSRSMDSIEKENTIQKKKTEKEIQENRLTNSDSHDENKREEVEKVVSLSKVIQSNKNQVVQSKKEAIAAVTKKNTPISVNRNENKMTTQKNGSDNLMPKNEIVVENKAKTEKPTEIAKTKDNLIATEDKENALAVIAKQKEQKEKIAMVEDKWSLQVFAGVNSSQNLKNQKSLGNTIESQNGHSYGVKTNYKLNRRWAVSTGLKVSELGQQVANVSYVNSAQSLVNVAKVPLSAPEEKGAIATNSNYLFIPNTSNNKTQNSAVVSGNTNFYETGDLSQKVQYLEMPMEVSYSILNKGKARINMNTGGFIGKMISNQVLLDNNSIGKNSDVNEVIFGTVLSSTLQYELFKKTKVFVEPGMNYYTQPLQNQNFNQFQLIFNFGLNVSF
jgi:hypothetical protein